VETRVSENNGQGGLEMDWEKLYAALKHDYFKKMSIEQRKDFVEELENMEFEDMKEALVDYFSTILMEN